MSPIRGNTLGLIDAVPVPDAVEIAPDAEILTTQAAEMRAPTVHVCAFANIVADGDCEPLTATSNKNGAYVGGNT